MYSKEKLKEILVNEYLNRFLTFYISRTSSIYDAEDLSQKAACECLDAIERVDDIQNINGYFWSIAHNIYKNYLNRKDNYILIIEKAIRCPITYISVGPERNSIIIRK